LNGHNDLRTRPGRQELFHLLHQTVAARLRFLDSLHQSFEGDLVRRMLEALRRKPEPMFAAPMFSIGINAAMS
jgi:hypothetical protein